MKTDTKVTRLYMFFGILFTTCLLISNIIAYKQLSFLNWSVPAAVLVFPISYMMSDVITEIYGFKAARFIMWLGFFMNLLVVLFFTLAIQLPAPGWFEGEEMFGAVLGNAPRALIASLAAYLIGAWANSAVLSKMKVMSEDGKNFGLRAVVSTLVGEGLDSLVFMPIAFLGILPLAQLPIMMLVQVSVKTVYEIIALPLTKYLVKKVKQHENIDTFDFGEKYNIVK